MESDNLDTKGRILIELARKTIEDYFSNKHTKADNNQKEMLADSLGIFVTLKKNGILRGCIGYTETDMQLYESVTHAALAAAFKDPRFPALEKEELDDVTIEVSVLTEPQWIQVRTPEEYLTEIKIGQDGLIVQGVYERGLLLPQVPVEQGWDVKTFIEQTCVKAGIPRKSWLDFDQVRLYKFQAIVFSEETPKGNIKRVM